jgi:membrane fusion protein (multidrug efflux system)
MTALDQSTLPAWCARAVIGLALLASANAQAQPKPGGAMPPTLVETTHPRLDAVVESVAAVGTLRAAESVVLKPELAGRVEKVHFEEGQLVAQGAPLFSLDASLMRAELREWEANVAQSQREAQRAAELVARKLISQSDVDAKNSVHVVNMARLSSAKARMEKTVIRAPFKGIVGLRQVSPGAYLNIGDPLVSVTQVDPLKLDLRVPEIYLARVAAGQRLTVELDAFPGQKFNGNVSAVDPQLDPNGRSVVLRASLANPEGKLRPGLFARVTLELGRRENALQVPEQALWPQGDKQFVYEVKDGKAALTEVKIGARKAGWVEIVSGLTPAAEIITAGQLKIGPGMPVKAVPAAAAGSAAQAAAH